MDVHIKEETVWLITPMVVRRHGQLYLGYKTHIKGIERQMIFRKEN